MRLSGDESIEVWGTGTASREFLFVRDAARAIAAATDRYNKPEPVNIGAGREISIRDLAELICRVVGFDGRLAFDTSKPDGTPQKLLDISRLGALGWRARIGLEEGIASAYEWFLAREQKSLHSLAT